MAKKSKGPHLSISVIVPIWSFWLVLMLALLTPSKVYADNAWFKDSIPERRKDQFPSEFAWYLIPFPFTYPGAGSGIFWMANGSNVFDTNLDVTAGFTSGEIGGKIFRLSELHIIPKTLFLSYELMDIDKLTVQNYEKRGMGTKKSDYKLMEFEKYYEQKVGLTLSFFERRAELKYDRRFQSSSIKRLRDSGGNVIADLAETYKSSSASDTISMLLDITDDMQDPRRGMRLELSRMENPRKTDDDPEYYVLNQNLQLYFPVGAISALAVNYLRSDAYVTSRGLTDQNGLISKIGLNCQSGDAECLAAQDELVTQFINKNTHGSSSGLGGLNTLRSYSSGRFQGAHSSFVSVEFRWNLTEEYTPFNYYIWEDTRTGVQIAFFAETGSVSELAGDLWKESRSSYGAGLRMVTGAGFVYRLDIATGDEGTAPLLWFFYPW